MKYLGLTLSVLSFLFLLIVFFQNLVQSNPSYFYVFFSELRVTNGIPLIIGFFSGVFFLLGIFLFFKSRQNEWDLEE